MNSHTTPTTTKNGTAAAAASAAAFKSMMAKRAVAHYHNVMAAKYFAAAMTVYWTRFLYARFASKTIRESSVMRGQVASARLARQVLNHPAYGFKSTTDKACRIAFCNIAFLVFLALKNTPLAFLTAHSYETLNPLHQVAGYTTMSTALVHLIVECLYFQRAKKPHELLEHEQIYGMIAACSMKKLRYEAFYIIHLTMFMLMMITVAMHRPDLVDKEVIVILVAASMWGDLHTYAVKNPGKSLRASVDGPYGAIPDFASTADKVILIAGGSGASFTFGVALDTVKRLPEASKTTIDFIWTVREEDKHFANDVL
ncbi:putative Ferric/cupric reductase transmembrane component 2 [Glarea lozoyensis 74030]|uniref:Putative Ferric/cupric reductase transmembrane component 2 n=1 Tax=Glarea lozoyensis (strain ATCC 74030 / MF5533) TaxID=1104152 RepID=H0EJG3_GLAL7|nr:putative Ferric/cupric reductase transmembrane component 2 [Glarea lozoyensis 74030]